MKTCIKCEAEKSLEEFHKRSKSKDGYQAICKICKASMHQQDGPRRRAMIKASRQKTVAIYRSKIVDYFKTHPCVDCGQTDIRVLEFDHLYNKEFNISAAVAHAGSWARIEKEIEKCEVRCANDHKIKTYERLGKTWHDAYMLP